MVDTKIRLPLLRNTDFDVMNYRRKKKKKALRPFWKYEVAVLIYLAAIAQEENTKKQIKPPYSMGVYC